MATRTIWDPDISGPGTETEWDGGSTLWDLLPDILSRVVRVQWLSPLRRVQWVSTRRRVRW